MKLYSYVVARDYGFAPNPFHGICSLATCKPLIRKGAVIGDWVVGTGSSKYKRMGHVVFAMKVTEAISYDQYWSDARFSSKKPNLTGSFKQAFGDNIYHRNTRTGSWVQVNSHHSLETGAPNPKNIEHDTQTDRVLISTEYIYWGAAGPKIPARFSKSKTLKICIGQRGHKISTSEKHIESFIAWLRTYDVSGFSGDPAEFLKRKSKVQS